MSRWVETFAALDHPLYNRWTEHVEAMLEAKPKAKNSKDKKAIQGKYDAFWPDQWDQWDQVIAGMEATSKGKGFNLIFPEDTIIKKGERLLILPRRAKQTKKKKPDPKPKPISNSSTLTEHWAEDA